MDINRKCPIVEIPWRSLASKEGRLVVAMPREHGVLKASVAGELLIIEQRAYVVGGMETVNPALPSTLPVIPATGWQLAFLQESHGFARQPKIFRVATQAANARQKDAGQGTAVVNQGSVVRRVAESDLVIGLKGAI